MQKRLIKEDSNFKYFTELTDPQDELTMVREMLKSSATVPTKEGMVNISDFVGEKRSFLLDRLYNIIYSKEEVEEETIKADSISKPVMKKVNGKG